MNISEASATAFLLHTITGGDSPGWDAEKLAKDLHFLNERSAKALQLSGIVTDAEIEIAARQIAQRAADAT